MNNTLTSDSNARIPFLTSLSFSAMAMGNVRIESPTHKHITKIPVSENSLDEGYSIFSLEGQLYRINFNYEDQIGLTFPDIVNSLVKVRPVQKTITVYEPMP